MATVATSEGRARLSTVLGTADLANHAFDSAE